jgi:hypothetical protein
VDLRFEREITRRHNSRANRASGLISAVETSDNEFLLEHERIFALALNVEQQTQRGDKETAPVAASELRKSSKDKKYQRRRKEDRRYWWFAAGGG